MLVASYNPDDVIITEGEIGDKFYIVLQGEVSISKGQKTTMIKSKITQKHLCDLFPWDSFGELALSQDVPRSVTAIAKTNCKLITLDQESYLNVIKNLLNYQVESIADFLSHLPLFHYVDRPLLVELAQKVEYKKFSTNTLILRQEDQPQHIFFIKSGRVKLLRKVEFRIPQNRSDACNADFLMQDPSEQEFEN